MTVFGLVLFLNFRFFEAYKQTDILSYCSDWFCRKLFLKNREGMDKKYYFYHIICQFDRSLFKTRDPESKHKTFIVKTFISLLYQSNLLKAYRGIVRVGQGFRVYGIQGLFKSGIRYIAA